MDKIVIKLSKQLTDDGTEVWRIASHTGLNKVDKLHLKSSDSILTKPIFLDVNKFENIYHEDGVPDICSHNNPLEDKPQKSYEFRTIEPVVLLRDCLAGQTFDDATKSPSPYIVDKPNLSSRALFKQETQSTDNDDAESDPQIPNKHNFDKYNSTSHNLPIIKGSNLPYRKSFKCEECSSTFIREYHFRRHQERHKKGTMNGDVSEEIFHSVFSLRHRLSSVLRYIMKKKHHLERPRSFRKKKFSSKEHRATRVDLLGREKSPEIQISRYICNVCPAQFEYENRLKSHLNIHKERPFTCNACFRTFTKKGALNIHAKKHRLPARFICPICFIEFPRKNFLKEHLNFHVSF